MSERAWLLRLRVTGEVLGRLDLIEQDMWNHSCQFTPEPSFGAYEPLFAEQAVLSERLEDDQATQEDIDRFDALAERITSEVELAHPDGSVASQDFLLSIDGVAAGFRSMEPV